MAVWEWIRFIIGASLIVFGLVVFMAELYGVYHYKYVLNRMHAAAMGDTLGVSSVILGLIVINGPDFTSVKLLMVIIFLSCASPVSSHLIAQLEAVIAPETKQYARMSLKEAEESLKAEKEDTTNA